jgi:hypothetical protein
MNARLASGRSGHPSREDVHEVHDVHLEAQAAPGVCLKIVATILSNSTFLADIEVFNKSSRRQVNTEVNSV